MWATLGVLTLPIAIAACDRGTDDAEPCKLATPPSAVAHPDPSGVTVTEQGWSTVRTDGNHYLGVSIGLMLKNTTDRVAYHTRVAFQALGASGASVVLESQAKYQVVEVPILLPGATIAVGNTLIAGEESATDRISVTPAVTSWLPTGGPDNGLAPVTATIDARASKRSDDGAAAVTMTVHSGNCDQLFTRGTAYVWRDSTGKIVGGQIGAGADCAKSGANLGPVTFHLDEGRVPAIVDMTRTTVSPYCDLSNRPSGATSAEPFN